MTKRPQFIISLFIIILFFAAVFPLFYRLSHQLLFLLAKNRILKKQYSSAVHYMEKAIWLQSNDYIYWNELGDVYFKRSLSTSYNNALQDAEQSKMAYGKAATLNPLDAEAFYGLALAEARLERLYPHKNRGANPYDSMPYFHKAIRLRPNSITYKYSLIRHLYYLKKHDKLLSAVSDLAKIYPSIHNKLKEETFWSSEIREAVKRGIQQAIKGKINLKRAYFEMSRLLSEEENWKHALFYYEKYLELLSRKKNTKQYLHLGELFLKTDQIKKAEQNFLNTLGNSYNREKDLKNILKLYTQTNHYRALLNFYKKAEATLLLPGSSTVSLAKTLFDLGQYDQARDLLLAMNKTNKAAENYYWLARIAEKKEDWAAMEVAAQEAVFMDEKNSNYHFLYYRILSRLKKLVEAESQLDLAIKYSPKPSAIFHIHRASIRARNNNFQGAAADWESVISLEPKGARYYAHAAKAYERLGKKSVALKYYDKAIQLDPDNKSYQKMIQELKRSHEKK